MAGFGVQPFGTSPFGIGGDGTPPMTATVQLDATPPRVRLDISTTAASVTIWRVATDGTRALVRTYDGGPLPVSGAAFLYDPEPPYGKPVYYVTDTNATSETVVVDVDDPWLTHPAVPSRSCKVRIAAISERQAAANQSARYPLGRRFPIVVSDGRRKADTYTLTLRTDTEDEVTALKQLFDDLSPLLLNIPASLGWVDADTEYVAVGDLTRANPVEYAGAGYREWTLPCTVVDRPAGGSQAFVTYGYLFSKYPTYADWKASGLTYGQMFDPE